MPNPRILSWQLTLLCVALLAGRVSGAHVHLCFDGTEPPSSFHLFDNGMHHAAPDLSALHADVDVSLAGDLLSKNKSGYDLPLLLLSCGPLFRSRRRFAYPCLPSTGFPAPPLFLLPPPRGPPLPTSP